MNRADQLAWLAKGMMTGAVALLLCAIMPPLVASGPEIQPVNSDGEAASALIAYRKEQTAQSILVGTSLAYRLKEQFFLPMQVRNLAVPGKSVLNVLNIVASYPKLPTSIFVETNVMVWPTDDDFVKKFSYSPGPRFQFAPPVRSLVSYLDSFRNADVRAPLVQSILDQPPAEYDNKMYIERAKVEWSGHKLDATILSNINALARLVQEIEARGSRVYFFDLPLAHGMADTDVVRTTKAAFAQRFTDTSRWLALKYPIEQLRFGDHAHLDDRSAIIVAHGLRDAARHR